MEDVITVAANLSTKGFEKGSKALKSAVSSLSRAAQSFGRTTQRGANTAISSFKRLIPTLIGVGSAYGILSKAVSSFMSQNEQLSSKMNSIWTALGNVLAPILTQIINWVTTAVSYFLEFLRLLGLTGKTASQLSQKANKSASQLQKTIAGFDELNVLQDNSGGGGANGHLDDVDPSAWMKKLANLLKNKMWDEAADMVIAKLNSLIYAFRDKAEEWGRIAGEWLQGITHFVARVLDETDWKQLGVGIANFLNGLLAEVEGINFGEDLGKILAAKFTIAIKIVAGVLETLDLGRIGYIISEMIKSFFDSISRALDEVDAAAIGQNIANFFNNIDFVGIALSILGLLKKAWRKGVNLLHGFLSNSENSAQNLGTAIKKFFEGIDWNQVKEDLKLLLKDAWNVAIKFLWGLIAGDSEEEPPIIKSLEKLRESVEKVFEKVQPLAEAIGPYIKDAFNWVVNEGLPKFLDDLSEMMQHVIDVFNGDKSVGDVIRDMNLLEGAIAGLAAIKLGSVLLDVASGIGKIISVFGGGAAAAGGGAAAAGGGGIGAAISGFVSSLGGLAVVGPVAAVAAIGVGVAISDANTQAEHFANMTEQAAGTTEGWIGVLNNLQGDLNRNAQEIQSLSDCGGDLTMVYMEQGQIVRDMHVAYEQLAESLGISVEELQRQIEAAGGDITQIEALKQSTDNLSESEVDIATKYDNTRQKLKELEDTMNSSTASGADKAKASKEYAKVQEELAELTEEYNKILNEQGLELDKNGQIVAKTADAVGAEAEAVTKGAEATQNAVNSASDLNATLDNTPESAQEAGEGVKDVGVISEETTSDVKEKFGDMKDTVTSDVDEMKRSVNDSFVSMRDETISSMSEMESSVSDSFRRMADAAQEGAQSVIWTWGEALSGLTYDSWNWGADMIVNFTEGMIQAVNNYLIPALNDAAQVVNNYLGFSEPKKGPLSNFHTFAPDMMELFASGINKESGKVMKAVSAVAEGVADRFSEGDFKIAPNLSALNALSENIPFQMPAVAGGGILPYSLDSVNGAAGASEGNAEIMGAVTQLFERLDRLQRTFEEMQFVAEFEGWRAIATRVRQEEKKMDRAGGR